MQPSPWFALYCSNERKAAQALAEAGFEVFAPTYLQMVKRGRQKLLHPVPLLPRYIFARIPPYGFPAVHAVEWVVDVLGEDTSPIPEPIMDELMRLVASGRLDEKLPAKRSRPRGERYRGLQSLHVWFDRQATQHLAQAA